MSGIQSSGGVWAPCLSHCDDRFYLLFTAVKRWRGERHSDYGVFKDTANFVMTAPSIDGPWSEPVFLNVSVFEPSLYHAEDGRKWLMNMEWDYRGSPTHFTGILLQEMDCDMLKPIGPVRSIFEGTVLNCVEGPHI